MQTAHNRNIAHYREHASEELTKLSLMRELSIREESLSAATLEADAAKTQIWLLEMMVDDATVEKARAVKVPSACAASYSCTLGMAVLTFHFRPKMPCMYSLQASLLIKTGLIEATIVSEQSGIQQAKQCAS